MRQITHPCGRGPTPDESHQIYSCRYNDHGAHCQSSGRLKHTSSTLKRVVMSLQAVPISERATEMRHK